ncbi:hypothetical protein ACHAXR_011357 [Thalassiosira sp. AJA248-18]
MSEELCELGVVGLTSIGQSLAAHHATKKTRVCVGDEDLSFVPQVINEFKSQMEVGEEEEEDNALPKASKCMIPFDNMHELVARLVSPRKIIIFGTHAHDQKFEEMWNKLYPLLEGGDVVLRWGREEEGNGSGNQFHTDSIVGNLSKLQAQPRGIHLLEMVRLERDRTVAFEGENPECFLVGGPQEGYTQLEPFILPCATIGHAGNGAGCAHYAGMIQRAIENGVTQAFAEGADVLTKTAGCEPPDIGRTMKKWNDEGGRLASSLTRISSKIYYKRDHITKNGFVIDHIFDSIDVDAKDTWVTMEATKLGVPAPTINATLESRYLSAMKDERVEASSILKVPEMMDTPSVMRDQISEDLQNAIYCACVCIVAECLAVFQAASEVESWDANMKECIRLWKQPGSLLESTLLERVLSALANYQVGDMKNLLIVPDIASELQEVHMSWRRVVTLSFASAVPCPTLSSSLTYYDSYRSRKLPIGLVRAQRDFFDASGYDRFGQGGWYTTCWVTPHTKEMRKKEGQVGLEGVGVGAPKKRRRRNKSIS